MFLIHCGFFAIIGLNCFIIAKQCDSGKIVSFKNLICIICFMRIKIYLLSFSFSNLSFVSHRSYFFLNKLTFLSTYTNRVVTKKIRGPFPSPNDHWFEWYAGPKVR